MGSSYACIFPRRTIYTTEIIMKFHRFLLFCPGARIVLWALQITKLPHPVALFLNTSLHSVISTCIASPYRSLSSLNLSAVSKFTLTSIWALLYCTRIDPNHTCSVPFHGAHCSIGNTVDSSEGTGLLIILTDDSISLFSLSPGTWRVSIFQQATTVLFIILTFKLFVILFPSHPTLWHSSSWNNFVK
jgi:hypothetical protein